MSDWDSIFEYRGGNLYWKISPCNNTKVGTKAGGKQVSGYIAVSYQGSSYYVHRIIYEMHYGYCPPLLDHIDQRRDNNLITNLRPIEYATNNINSKESWSSCGYRGVSYYKSRNSFMAKIGFKGRSKFLGYFKTPEEASIQYEKAREELYPGVVKIW